MPSVLQICHRQKIQILFPDNPVISPGAELGHLRQARPPCNLRLMKKGVIVPALVLCGIALAYLCDVASALGLELIQSIPPIPRVQPGGVSGTAVDVLDVVRHKLPALHMAAADRVLRAVVSLRPEGNKFRNPRSVQFGVV